MPVRTQVATVVFRRPFVLRGLRDVQAPGAYLIETCEALPEDAPFAPWRWHSTVIRLQPEPALTRSASVDPEDLDAALARDRAPVDIRLESAARQAHRVGKKVLFEFVKAEKLARDAAGDAAGRRREE